jgi:hypothetical protein
MTRKLTPTGQIQINAQQSLTRFHLTDGETVFEVELPVEPFLIFSGRLYQGMLRARNEGLAGAERPDRKPALMPEEFEIATLDLPEHPSVVLVLDGGTSREVSIAIPLHHARAVGEAICSRANEIANGIAKN